MASILLTVNGQQKRVEAPPDEPLLAQVARSIVPFDRDFWRLLAGEVLLYGAASVPEILTAPDTLGHLLAPGQDDSPIRQAHFGARGLAFGGGIYRPDAAGWNDAEDVARLADYLAAIDYVICIAGEDNVGIGTDFTQGQDDAFFEYISHDKGYGWRVTGPLGDVVNPTGMRTLGDFPI